MNGLIERLFCNDCRYYNQHVTAESNSMSLVFKASGDSEMVNLELCKGVRV